MSTAVRTQNNKVDLLTNVPVRMSIKYIDVYPDSGKGYGPSMRFKGTVDGAEAIVYPKGKVWAALKALQAAGVIAAGEYAEEPTEKYSIPVRAGDVEMAMKQGPGEKWASFTVAQLSALKAQAAPAPRSIGDPIPGLDDSPFPPTETGAPPASDPFEQLWALYDRCLTKAHAFAKATGITNEQAIVAIAATGFIEANKRGIR